MLRALALPTHFALSTVLSLLLAGSATAATLRVSGSYLDGRGQINIPVIGNPIPVSGLVNVTNPDSTGPATITAVGKFFDFAGATANIPLPGPTNAQLFTSIMGSGPASPLQTAGVTTPAAWVGKLAPVLSPQRPLSNFAFCPGATANPACATHKTVGQGAGASQGTRHGIIKYTAASPQFGGTMRYIIDGFVSLTVVVGATPRFSHQPVGGGASQAQYTGGHYNIGGSNYLGIGVVTTGAILTSFGAILSPGTTLPPPSGTGTPATNVINGFPFTVGTVYGKATLGATPQTITTVGSDNRTVNGRGNIQLVAGSVSSTGAAAATININRLSLDIASGQLTPAMSPTGFIALGSLVLLGGGYLLRRR